MGSLVLRSKIPSVNVKSVLTVMLAVGLKVASPVASLKMMLLNADAPVIVPPRVMVPVVALKFTIPPLAVKAPELDQVPPTDKVLVVAFNVPAEMVTLPLTVQAPESVAAVLMV